MAYGNEFELEYEFESHLLKQKLSSMIQERFPGMYTNFKRNESTFRVYKGKTFAPPNEKVTSIQDDLFDEDEEEKHEQAKSEDEYCLQNLEKNHDMKVITHYRNEMGFTLVIEEMIKSK